MNRIAFRIDDIGACSKRYEIYSNRVWKIGRFKISGNWLYLKYLPRIRKWGPYREMRAGEWYAIFDLLEEFKSKLTVGVTAAWAISENQLIPFPMRFEREASALKDGVESGLVEIANHGLTHCVLKDNLFKPRWFSGNRKYHREFWDWVPTNIQETQLRRAQEILENYFQVKVVTLIPPGNVFSDATLEIGKKLGLIYISCNTPPGWRNGVVIIGDQGIVPFHDRDIVINGTDWFRKLLQKYQQQRHCFVKELGETLDMEVSQGGASEKKTL